MYFRLSAIEGAFCGEIFSGFSSIIASIILSSSFFEYVLYDGIFVIDSVAFD